MRNRRKLKTYSHLLKLGHVPDEYDLGTSDLLWYLGRGFEVNTPLASWYAQHQKAGPLGDLDWSSFQDPRRLTYGRYVAIQTKRETFLDELLDNMQAGDERLDKAWKIELLNLLSALRFPCHGLQMCAG